jgi:2,4-dienoyl-CoA reductase-like NADH-dependent reductase (Old Yellow Enzyme family)
MYYQRVTHTNMIFSPAKIGDLTLRNRIIRAGCFEGMAQGGEVTEQLIDHHRELARGGIAMTTVGYLAVSHDGRAFEHELWMRKELLPGLRRLTDAVHREGAAASVQLVHCGFFADPKVIGRKPLGASRKLCTFRMSVSVEMMESDIEEKTSDFAAAAVFAREAGFDAVEVHAGHGYLLSQFLSLWTNRRKDRYGGSLQNRLRFPADVLQRIRSRVGDGFPILVKMNQTDGMSGGLSLDEAVEVAKGLEAAGASAIIPSCGFTAKTPFMMMRGNLPTREMAENQADLMMKLSLRLFGRLFVQYYPYRPLFLLEGALRIREAVDIPVVYVGGVLTKNHIQTALGSGFEFVQVGRATVRDPAFVENMETGVNDGSDCDICNRCVAAMDGGGVYCVSREKGPLEDSSP